MRLKGSWKVTLPGETYTWEPDDTTVNEELMLENELGTSFDEWLDGIDERRAIPCQVLVWFLRRKAGRQEDRMGVDFPIRRLELEKIKKPDVNLPESPAVSETSETATESPSPVTESDPGSGTA